MTDVSVLDDFMPSDFHDEISRIMCGYGFPWFYNDSVIYDGSAVSAHFQFTHVFYMRGRPASDYFAMVEPLIERIGIRALIKMKANLVTRAEQIQTHGMHTDVDFADSKTAVYYVNSNDGYTEFADGTKVKSVANRLVTFPSCVLHTGSNCTDQKTRVVINVNYF